MVITGPAKRTVMLMGATFGTGNMGVSALTAGTIEAAVKTWPDAQIILLDYGEKAISSCYSSAAGPVTVNVLNIRFSKKLYLINNIAVLIVLAAFTKILPHCFRRIISARNPYLRRINTADVLLAISGGDSFSDIYGLGRFFYVSLPQILIQLLGKKLILLPQTIGPFNTMLARTVARMILKHAAFVYSRDYEGLKEIRHILSGDYDPDRFRFCYDVGFLVNPVRPQKIDIEAFSGNDPIHPAVGLNVSGLLWMGGYSQNNQFGLKTDYRVLVKRLIDHLICNKGVNVVLIPHVFGGVENPESDQGVCESLYQELGEKYLSRLFFVRGRYDQSEIKYIIGLCDFFIGARMHACIAALSQGVPTVPVAYSKKFAGVMKTIGVESCVADPRTMDEPEILHRVDRTWEDRDRLRQHLESKMSEVKVRLPNLFKEIEDSLRISK